METVIIKIKKEAQKLLDGIGIKAEIDAITTPPDPKLGDFSFPVFSAAKEAKKNPAEFAAKAIEGLGARFKYFSKVETAGPYINFFVDPNKLAELALAEIGKEKNDFGNNNTGKGKKLMVEFSQPNTHKEFHVGHSRGTLLGQSLVNILLANGYKVISANYYNDSGANVAKWLWCYTKFHNGEEPKDNRAEFLSHVYAEANEKSKDSEEAKLEISEIKQKFEQGDRELVKIWKKSRKWSIDQFKEIYKLLGVKFDECFYESDQAKEGREVVKKLLDDGIAQKSQGAVIIDLEKYNLGAFLILKSDGTALYSTHDLPLAQKKFKEYKIDASWYVVDVRQSLYFQQLFKTLEMMGFKEPMRHVDYDFVSTPKGVISSRLGKVPTFIGLYNELFNLAKKSTKERHKDWSEKEVDMSAEKISLSAIKFEMLKTSRKKEIIFDPEKALSFEGFTGPYILYTIARISSILKKARSIKNKKFKDAEIVDIEKELLLKIIKYPEILKEAAIEAEPAHIAQYSFELAQKFAEFYHKQNVLKAESPEKEWRLALIGATKEVLENGLDKLGIKYLKKM